MLTAERLGPRSTLHGGTYARRTLDPRSLWTWSSPTLRTLVACRGRPPLAADARDATSRGREARARAPRPRPASSSHSQYERRTTGRREQERSTPPESKKAVARNESMKRREELYCNYLQATKKVKLFTDATALISFILYATKIFSYLNI